MNTGRKENSALREYISLHWGKMPDLTIAKQFDCSRDKVRAMRVAMGLVRTKAHLDAMYEAQRTGTTEYFGRTPTRELRRNA